MLGTWFGCGYFPKAPGTAGTIGAVPLYLALRPLGPWALGAAVLIVTAVGVWAAGEMERRMGVKDPQIVCIDEAAGVLLTWVAAPLAGWKAVVAGVVLFRIFDQLKPFPARTAERRLPGGWGIMGDDIAAGVWGMAAMGVLRLAGWV